MKDEALPGISLISNFLATITTESSPACQMSSTRSWRKPDTDLACFYADERAGRERARPEGAIICEEWDTVQGSIKVGLGNAQWPEGGHWLCGHRREKGFRALGEDKGPLMETGEGAMKESLVEG